jgi:hypothetical protein
MGTIMLRKKQLFARMTLAGGFGCGYAIQLHATSLFCAEWVLGKEVNSGDYPGIGE